MILNNLICNGENNVPVNISIEGEIITGISSASTPDNLQINFTDAIAYPGLINSHDHLDFNCFQPLGNKIYKNYKEWGRFIHSNYREEINKVLKIPVELRERWGVYKNLLAGVTTVVNHGAPLKTTGALITVLKNVQSLHSVGFEKGWKWKLNDPFKKNKLCVVHVGEGTDTGSSQEIDALLKWNLIKRKLVGIHAVAMNAKQAKQFKVLVWCPESNLYLLNATADIKSIMGATDIIFGTDSTLTGNWNIWQHLRLAKSLQQADDRIIFNMVTKTAAKTWGINSGALNKNNDADIVIVKNKKSSSFYDLFFETDPEDILMTVSKGKIRMFDADLYDQVKQMNFNEKQYSSISINGRLKYVEGDLPKLIKDIQSFYPGFVLPFNS